MTYNARSDSIVSINKRSGFDYFLEKSLIAGIELKGAEVKSARLAACSIQEAYCIDNNGEMFIMNMNISPHSQASSSYDSKRPRKLLLKKKEIINLIGKVKKKGFCIIPVKLFFQNKSLLKVEIALAKSKNQVDKRREIMERDLRREEARDESQ